MSYSEQLLTHVLNTLRILAWQNTKDGSKGKNVPEPIQLPEEVLEEGKRFEKNRARARAIARRNRLRGRS